MESFLSTVHTGGVDPSKDSVSALTAMLHPNVVVLSEGPPEWSSPQSSLREHPIVGPLLLAEAETHLGVGTRTVGAGKAALFAFRFLGPAYHPKVLAVDKFIMRDDEATVVFTGPTLVNGDLGMLAPHKTAR